MKKTRKRKEPNKKSEKPPESVEMIVWKELPPDDPILELKPTQILAAQVLASLQYSKHDKVYTGAVDAASVRAGVGYKTIYRWLEDFNFVRYVEMLKAMRATMARENLWQLGDIEHGSVAANIYELKLYNTSKFNDQFLAEKELLELKIKLQELEVQQAALKMPEVIAHFDANEPAIPEELKAFLKVTEKPES